MIDRHLCVLSRRVVCRFPDLPYDAAADAAQHEQLAAKLAPLVTDTVSIVVRPPPPPPPQLFLAGTVQSTACGPGPPPPPNRARAQTPVPMNVCCCMCSQVLS
jgi:hypothetical protein